MPFFPLKKLVSSPVLPTGQFVYTASSSVIGALPFKRGEQPGSWPILESNRMDYQCPPNVTEGMFTKIAQQQEAQYLEIMQRHSPDLYKSRVVMPACGSLLNFTPTLLSLGCRSLECSEITPENELATARQKDLKETYQLEMTLNLGQSAQDHLHQLIDKGHAGKIDVIILPWFSMYLEDPIYTQLVDLAHQLLKPDGVLYERYSAAQAFNQTGDKLAMTTRFRSTQSVRSFYDESKWTCVEDVTINAFKPFTEEGQRLMVLKPTRHV